MSLEAAATIQALSTVVLVFVTYIYVRQTASMAETAREAIEHSVRPHLDIHAVRSRLNAGGYLEVEVVLRNVGQGQAVGVEFLVAVSKPGSRSSPDFDSEPMRKHVAIGVVGQGARSPLREPGQPDMYPIIFSGDDISDDVRGVVEGAIPMNRVFAVVRYRSITGASYETRRCEGGVSATVDRGRQPARPAPFQRFQRWYRSVFQ